MRTMELNRLSTAHVSVQAAIQQHIEWLSAQLADVDQQMQTMIQTHATWRGHADILQSMPGVGPGLTRTLLARLPE